MPEAYDLCAVDTLRPYEFLLPQAPAPAPVAEEPAPAPAPQTEETVALKAQLKEAAAELAAAELAAAIPKCDLCHKPFNGKAWTICRPPANASGHTDHTSHTACEVCLRDEEGNLTNHIGDKARCKACLIEVNGDLDRAGIALLDKREMTVNGAIAQAAAPADK